MTSTCGTGFFQITLSSGTNLPGTAGDPIYATGSVNVVGTQSNSSSKYLTWPDYQAGTSSYQVTLNDPNTLTPITTTLEKAVYTPFTTTVTQSTNSVTTQVATTASPSMSLDVVDGAGIVPLMEPFGGKSVGSIFSGQTVVSSVQGTTVNLNKATLAPGPTKGADVTFTLPFKGGVTQIRVQDVSGIEKGMVPFGGMPSGGNAFSATTTVTAIDPISLTVTLSESTLSPLTQGSSITFSPANTQQIIVASTTGIKTGMTISGGAPSPGNSFGPNTFVTAIDISNKTLSLSEPVTINKLTAHSSLSLFPPMPSQKIGVIGSASKVVLCIPSTQNLTGGRLIFTLGKPGNFPFNSAKQPLAPVPYKDNVKNLYYDFIEFAWTISKTGVPNLNYDTSIVDQFGIPITIEFSGVSNTKRGIEKTSATVVSEYQTYVPAQIKANISSQSTPSQKHVSSFFNGLSIIRAPYRILAPSDAFLLAQEFNAPPTVVSQTKGVNTYFDQIIKNFFDAYDQSIHSGATFDMVNVSGAASTGKVGSGLHDFSGHVTTIAQKGTDQKEHNYRVLQLTDVTPGINAANGYGLVYNVYEPFFSSNGYSGKNVPPYWLKQGVDANGNAIPLATRPTEMVFGASGVFADSDPGGTLQPTPSGANQTNYQILLGAIENQLVTAINRGIALIPQWRWLYQSVDNSAKQTPQVTVNTGNTLSIPASAYVPVYKGMSVTQIAGTQAIGMGTASSPNIVTDVSLDGVSKVTTVTLSMSNLMSASNIQVSFSYSNIANPFYQKTDPMSQAPFNGVSFNNAGVWDYFSQFFHLPYHATTGNGVSISGLAYAYAFDDQGNFSTDISMDNPSDPHVNIGT